MVLLGRMHDTAVWSAADGRDMLYGIISYQLLHLHVYKQHAWDGLPRQPSRPARGRPPGSG